MEKDDEYNSNYTNEDGPAGYKLRQGLIEVNDSYTHLPSISHKNQNLASPKRGANYLKKGKAGYNSARKGLGPGNKYGLFPSTTEFEAKINTIDLEGTTKDLGLKNYLNSSMEDYKTGM